MESKRGRVITCSLLKSDNFLQMKISCEEEVTEISKTQSLRKPDIKLDVVRDEDCSRSHNYCKKDRFKGRLKIY